MAIELYSKATLDTLLAAKLSDAPSDGSTYGRKDGAWEIVAGGSPAWGSITGTVTDQTDLTTYLSGNYYPLSSNPAGYLTSVPGKSVNTLSSAYTLASGDANNIVYVPTGSGLTITVPDDASYSFPVGTEITVVFDGSFGGTVYFVPQDTMTPAPVLLGTTSVNVTSITTMIKVSANLWVIQ